MTSAKEVLGVQANHVLWQTRGVIALHTAEALQERVPRISRLPAEGAHMRGADVALRKHLPWILAAARLRPVEIASTIWVGATDELVVRGSAFALKTNMLRSNTKPTAATELRTQSGQDHFPVGGEESPRLQDQRKTQR